ncbi:MAG TPA: pyridoxal 5'-phosphate synthase glutaminase subunit PdxT [Acholeplasmatales bacterium]|nr:pyridoxal 5'-phosphate synthase glutaminase subunit PdxT [Acholeplasmatales bacterium]
MRIGILALQGAFLEHEQVFNKLGVEYFEIRQKSHLNVPFDGLILPGGESTVMGKLLRDLDLYDELRQMIVSGLPVFGTCAGCILLAKRFTNEESLHFATMDITVVRNAFGRQLGSFLAQETFNGSKIPMVFIRAPYMEKVGKNVKVLAEVYGKIVAAREGNQLVTAFHPELTSDNAVHQYFIDMINHKK